MRLNQPINPFFFSLPFLFSDLLSFPCQLRFRQISFSDLRACRQLAFFFARWLGGCPLLVADIRPASAQKIEALPERSQIGTNFSDLRVDWNLGAEILFGCCPLRAAPEPSEGRAGEPLQRRASPKPPQSG
jgi:hypothetical protein